MFNIMKADLYRVLRSKGFYITLVLFITLTTLQVIANTVGQMGAMSYSNDSNLSVIGETEIADGTVEVTKTYVIPESEPLYTGMTAPFAMMGNADNILYFMLAFIIFIAGADFSSGGVKNTLSNGTSRTKYYLSKLILSCVICVVILFINIVLPIIVGTVKNGFGGDFTLEYCGRLIRPFLAQIFMCLSVVSVGIFLTFTTKKIAAVNGAYIAFLIVPLLLVFIFVTINNKLDFLFDYDLVSNIRLLVSIDTLETTNIIRAFAIGTFYMLASTIGGILIFRKSEIK